MTIAAWSKVKDGSKIERWKQGKDGRYEVFIVYCTEATYERECGRAPLLIHYCFLRKPVNTAAPKLTLYVTTMAGKKPCVYPSDTSHINFNKLLRLL